MEKIQPLINFLKKNKFWLSCGVMALVLIGVWMLTSMELSAQQDKNTKELKSKLAELTKVLSTGAEVGSETNNLKAHPNDSTKEGMETRISDAADSMIKAWKLRRAAQEPIMKWPTEVLTDPKFVKFFSRFDPPEAFNKVSSNEFFSFLQVYTAEIQKRMPELCKIVGTQWNYKEQFEKAKATSTPPKAGNGDAPKASMATDTRPEKVVVEWNKDNQALWLQKLTLFKNIDGNNTEVATAHQAFALQQDLWLLEAVFKVIKAVNGDADANDLAVIRVIDHIVFGREARAKLGTTVIPDTDKFADASAKAASGTGGNTGVGPNESLVKGNDAFSTAPPAPGQDPTKKEFSKDPPDELLLMGPFHGRYVDVNYEPLGIDQVYEVLRADAKGLPERNLELIVAKRVPVRIALKMNETKIPNFIAACSNSEFGFEIYQIRINRHKPGENIELYGGAKKSKSGTGSNERDNPSAAMGGGQEQGGSGVDGGGNDESAAGGGSRVSGGNAVGPFKAERRTNHIVDVEFYGIVKIYNPVNESRLKPVEEAAPTTPNPTVNSSGSATTTKSGKP
jgi:hypothetical protein